MAQLPPTPDIPESDSIPIQSSEEPAKPGFPALHGLKIILLIVGIAGVSALVAGWPWITNELFNRAPKPEQFSNYIQPLVAQYFQHPQAVKIDIMPPTVTQTGRGKAEAQVSITATSLEDFLTAADFVSAARDKGYDSPTFEKTMQDAQDLPGNLSPVVPNDPIPTLAQVATPKGTQQNHSFVVSAVRTGANWSFSLSPDESVLSGIEDFHGSPRSSWTTQPLIAGSEESDRAISSFIESHKVFIAAVQKAKADYAKSQAEDLQRKQAADALAKQQTDNSYRASPQPSASAISSAPSTGPMQANGISAVIPKDPKTGYPLTTKVKGKVTLRLQSKTLEHPDALVIQCDASTNGLLNVQGTVMLVDDPAAATSKVGDMVEVQGRFLATVQFTGTDGKATTLAQYQDADAPVQNNLTIAQSPDDQLNAIYRQILAEKKVDPGSLKKVQLLWLAYRDSQAELDAWGAGKTAPDEELRKASLARSTEERIAELQHIAQDGTSGDIPTSASDADKDVLTRTFAGLTETMLTKQLSGPMLAFMPGQQAWLNFSIAQAKLDEQSLANSSVSGSNQPSDLIALRFDHFRLEKLNALAIALGIQNDVSNVGATIPADQLAQFALSALTTITVSNNSSSPSNLSGIHRPQPPPEAMKLVGTYTPINQSASSDGQTTYATQGSFRIFVNDEGKLCGEGSITLQETAHMADTSTTNYYEAQITKVQLKNSNLIMFGNFHCWWDTNPKGQKPSGEGVLIPASEFPGYWEVSSDKAHVKIYCQKTN